MGVWWKTQKKKKKVMKQDNIPIFACKENQKKKEKEKEKENHMRICVYFREVLRLQLQHIQS